MSKHQQKNKTINKPAMDSKKPNSKSMMSRISSGLKRYWFVAVPAIMLNIGITLDHVIAKNNETFYRARIKEVVMEALEATQPQEGAALGDTLSAHWIQTNDQGNLDGRISAIESSSSSTMPIERLDVALLRNGEKIRTATTDFSGKFVLVDVEPGVYTLIAAGQNGFLAYGVHVLPKLDGFDVLDANTSIEQQKQKRAFYVSYQIPQESVVVDSLQIDAAAVPPSFTTLQRISQNYLPSGTSIEIKEDQNDSKATDQAADISSSFKYPLTTDGSLEGRIQPIATSDGQVAKLSKMNVFLIQDDIEAARVDVEENGKFRIPNVKPGVYSLVAAGEDGFAALSMELEQGLGGLNSSVDGKANAYFVSNRPVKARGPLTIAIATGAKNLKVIQDEINRVSNPPQQPPVQFVDQGIFPQDGFGGGFPGDQGVGGFAGPTGTGGFAPSGPAGGGRFAPGRRPGRIAALIGLGLGITALATNDSKAANPPPSSPTNPTP